jgi:hypothetical protein
MKSSQKLSARALGLLALLIFSHSIRAIAANPEFGDITKPDFFPILPWDPYHGWSKSDLEHTDENGLKSIAECNFNLGGFVLPRDLKDCRKYGLGAIMFSSDPGRTNVDYIYQWRRLSDEQIVQRVKDMVRASKGNPSVKGYFITDEPGINDFPALAKAVAAVKKFAPGKLAYINLFPDYATLGAPDLSQLGTSNYTEYLERFVNEVHPQLISYDNYQVEFSMDLKDRAKASSYYHNLLAVRAVALEHHLPCLNIVSANQIQPQTTIPSPANLLFQAYTTLAAGYRGVTWYTYYQGGYHYGPIDSSGKKTQVWAYLKEVNRQVATLAPLLSRMESTGVFFSAPAPADNLPSLPGELVASVRSSTPVMIGEFKHQDGRRYVMVVNLSLENTTHLQLTMRQSAQPVSLVSTMDGSLSPMGSPCDLWLPAGQGALLLLGK